MLEALLGEAHREFCEEATELMTFALKELDLELSVLGNHTGKLAIEIYLFAPVIITHFDEAISKLGEEVPQRDSL